MTATCLYDAGHPFRRQLFIIYQTGFSTNSALVTEIQSMGHTLIPSHPALTQLVSDEKWVKHASGVKVAGIAKLYANGEYIIEKKGDLLFTNYGISGLAILDLSREVEPLLGHVNTYLDDRPDELQAELDDAVEAAMALAEDPFETSDEFFQEVLQLRLTAGELALRASQSAMLHTGAKGYLQTAPAQRKLRESYFVAIVTPAIKHLRKELDRLSQAA